MNSLLRNHQTYNDLCNFCLKMYKANRNAGRNKTSLGKSAKITSLLFKCGMVILSTTAILTCIRPAITFASSGQLEPILPTIFPGINEQEIFGFTCLYIFHFYIMALFVMGTAGIDLGLMALVIHSHTMSHIFQNAVTDLNALAKKNNRKSDTKEKEVRAYLNNLIAMHIDFIKYTKLVKHISNEVCLVQISMANTTMVVLVYVILLVKIFAIEKNVLKGEDLP
ncbi:hypothetical protein Bhyg_13339 [Pseudolycoriella hygida]|uniref:Uncharacterized protein n=1 Tax=Pseudolycoriella hygida TaxID=35572 RepID=A0A9Q0MMN4_9DIPT|nr:hypothetical protein Bhyg_13339 [Pseudolycoriella hygida]